MLDSVQLRAFYHVAKHEGYSTASQQIGVGVSTLSAQVSQLQKQLGAKLFERHKRGVTLTKQGEMLYNACQHAYNTLDSVENIFLNRLNHRENNIRLKLATTFALASHWLVDLIPEFLDRHPFIELTVQCLNKNFELHLNEVHAALCPKIPSRTDLVQKHVKDCTFKLYASSAYLEQHGVPLSMEDLLHKHRSIIYSQDGTRPFSMADGFINREKVNFKQGMQPITVNSVQAMLTLAQQGLGIVSLERDMKVLKTNGLQRILESEYEFTAGVYLVYPKLFEETKEVELLDRFFLKTSIGSKPEN